MSGAETEAEKDGLFVSKAKQRLVYLSTFVAGITSLTLPGLVVAATTGYVDLGAIPQPWFALYAAATTGSYSYALDVNIVDRIGGTVNGNSGSN